MHKISVGGMKGESLTDKTYVQFTFSSTNLSSGNMQDNPAAKEQAGMCRLACRRHRGSEHYERVEDHRRDRV